MDEKYECVTMNLNQNNLCATQNICLLTIRHLCGENTLYINERRDELFVFGAVVLLLAWYQLSLYACVMASIHRRCS